MQELGWLEQGERADLVQTLRAAISQAETMGFPSPGQP